MDELSKDEEKEKEENEEGKEEVREKEEVKEEETEEEEENGEEKEEETEEREEETEEEEEQTEEEETEEEETEEEHGEEEEEEEEWENDQKRETDEEEDEIEQIITSSSHLLKCEEVNRRTMSLAQSCSAHANLNSAKGQWHNKRETLELEAEEGEEGEDSDEEIIAQHSALVPLRKSKSAFADFLRPSQIANSKQTAAFACPIIIKKLDPEKENEQQQKEHSEGIEELIDLARGDVLRFRMSHHLESCASPSRSCCSSSASSLCLDGRTISRWSAPAANSEKETETDDEMCEWGEGEAEAEEEGRKGSSFGMYGKRSGGSWSAPSGLSKGRGGSGGQKRERRKREAEREEGNERKEEEEKEKRREKEKWKEEKKKEEEEEEKWREEENREVTEEKHKEPREEEEEKEEEDEQGQSDGEEEENASEWDKIGGQHQNMKHLEIDTNGWHFHGKADGAEEMMSTSTDEEEYNDDEENEKRIVGMDQQRQMRVFVSRNCYPMMRCRRNLPTSRSDSQLLWNRQLAQAAPPPPASFPLEETEEEYTTGNRETARRAKTREITHSKTHVGLLLCKEIVEDEQWRRGEKEGEEEEEEEEEEWKMEEEKKKPNEEEGERKCRRKREEEEEKREEENLMMEEIKTNLEEEKEFKEELDEKMCPQKSAVAFGPFPALSSFNDSLHPYPILFRRQKQAQQAKVLAMRMSLPNPPICHFNHSNFLPKIRAASSVDEIPMVDDCPSPNQSPLLPSEKMITKRMAEDGASLSLAANYSEDEESGGDETEGKGKRREKLQRSAAESLCRRGSPPLAQNELLSESEISDLEQQIASGRLEERKDSWERRKIEEGTEQEMWEEERSDKDGKEEEQEEMRESERMDEEERKGVEEKEGEERKRELEEEREEEEENEEEEGEREMEDEWTKKTEFRKCFRQHGEASFSSGEADPLFLSAGKFGQTFSIGTSSSMPIFPSNASKDYWGGRNVQPNFWQSEYSAEENGNEWAEGRKMQRSATAETGGRGGAGRRTRRVLPTRPDEQKQSAGSGSGAWTAAEEGGGEASFCAILHRRLLPSIPSTSGEPLDKIDFANATKEHLLNAFQQQKPCGSQQQIGQMHFESAEERDEEKREEEGKKERGTEQSAQFCQTVPILPSPTSVVKLSKVPFVLDESKWAFRSPLGHYPCQNAQSEEYKLSYGMDQSALRLAQRGLSIEESYYEDADGLNGNLTYGGTKGRKEWEENADPHSSDLSLYNIADGNKSSSGISSCCTTSSRSCEPPETNRFMLAKKQRHFKAGDEADPTMPTHRAQFPFMPRHSEQIELQKGDAIRILEKYEDHWCHGINLRSGKKGIFPEAHVVEIDLVDEICRSVLPDGTHHANKIERDTFYLTMLASIEVAHHKGNDVLMQAINKVCSVYQQKEEILVPQTVLMEISFRGVHVIDKRKRDIFRCPTFDFFFSLQNISFCGAHPKELRYFGFITKHPLLPRFACHVFLSSDSTQPIVEAIGRAFKRSYDEYMAFAHPTEDIFIE